MDIIKIIEGYALAQVLIIQGKKALTIAEIIHGTLTHVLINLGYQFLTMKR